MLNAYTITFLLTGLLFFYTLFKLVVGQYSSLIFFLTVIGCVFTMNGLSFFPLNILILIILFSIPFVIDFLTKRASDAMRKDDYNTCYKLIRRDPTNAAAYAKLGDLLLKENKYNEALSAYEKSLSADDKQKDIERRYQALVEQLALKESKQIKCSNCNTIVPFEYGKCWKCEKIFNKQQYIFSIIKNKGITGIVALSTSFVSLLTTLFILTATVNGLLKSNMAFSISLTITTVAFLTSFLIYKK